MIILNPSSKTVLRVLTVMLMAQVTTQLIVAQGTWYNSNWQYRSPIIITNPGGILTDFQVKISLGSSFPWNHTNPDGSDMRFTTSDGITEINYWIESWTLSSSASIWVKVPTVAANPATTTIYLYYGNSSATSTASGDNTFDFFDGFDGTSINLIKWKFTIGNQTQTTVGSGVINLSASSTNPGEAPPFGPYTKNPNRIIPIGDPGYTPPPVEGGPFPPGEGFLAENIVYDAITGHYWMVFTNNRYFPRRTGLLWSDDPTNPLAWNWNAAYESVIVNAVAPHIMYYNSKWYIFYADRKTFPYPISVASADVITGPYTDLGVVLPAGGSGSWEDYRVDEPYVFQRSDGMWIMMYMGDRNPGFIEQVGYAYSNSLTGPYTKFNNNPCIPFGPAGSFDAGTVADPWVYEYNGIYYIGYTVSSNESAPYSTALATTTDWQTFTKQGVILPVGTDYNSFRGAVTKIGNTYLLPYTSWGTRSYTISIATQPVLVPSLCIRGTTSFGMNFMGETRARHQNWGTLGLTGKVGFVDDAYNTVQILDDSPSITNWQRVAQYAYGTTTQDMSQIADNGWHVFHLFREGTGTAGFQIDDNTIETASTNVPTMNLSPFLMSQADQDANQVIVDWTRVRKWVGTDPGTVAGSEQSYFIQWTGAVSADWNNPLNWSSGVLPDANLNVNITAGGNQPVISSNALCNNITINSGASLQITDTYTLTVSGNWSNNGTFTANQSTVVFNGTSQQIGAGGFYNLTLNGSGTVTFASTAVVSGTLTASQNIIISTGASLVNSSTMTASNQYITISTGASFTVGPLAKATVGTITNNGTLNLNSDASGIASLILDSYTDNGTENIELYLTGGGNATNYPWHYISSPVTSLSTNDVMTSGNDPDANDLAAYYENLVTTDKNSAWWGSDGWNYQSDNGLPTGSSFNVLEVGRGYNYYSYYDGTRTFGGNLNTGLVSRGVTYTGSTPNLEFRGWNLMGNPFTSSIDWDGIGKPFILNAIYFTRNNGFASYVNGVGAPDETITGIIPPMQGFFVKTNRVGGTTMYFYPDSKVHSNVNRYKGNGESIPLVRLKIEGLNMSDGTVLRFDDKASTNFDSEFDAYKFSKTGTSVSLWTNIGQVSYSINSIPFPETETEIPVGIYSTESGTYKLSATQMQRLDGYDVFIVDKTSGTTTNLKNTPTLSFAAPEGIVNDRFVIKISNISTGIENPVIPESIFNIYSLNGMLNINPLSDEWTGKSGSVGITDLTGKTVKYSRNIEFWKGSLIQLPVSGLKGIYFVEFRSGVMRSIGKVMIK